MKKELSLPIPGANNYKPFPSKDDGYKTTINLFADKVFQSRKYTGRLTVDELPAYIKNEYINGCTVMVESLMYYKYDYTVMVRETFKVSK